MAEIKIRRSLWRANLGRPYGEPEDRERVKTELEANLIGSELEGNHRLHAPVIDIDIPHQWIPSSTPGHGHIYFDIPVPWRKYKRLLRAMYKAGIIEKGFYKFSIYYKGSFVRRPGVFKEAAEVIAEFRKRA